MDGLVPGRIVYFVFAAAQADEVMRRRTNGPSIAERIKSALWPIGAQAHIGNSVTEGTIAPAMIVAVNGPSGNSNLKVMLDGTDVYWALSRDYDEKKTPGTWHWMFDGQQKRYVPASAQPPSTNAVDPSAQRSGTPTPREEDIPLPYGESPF